MKDKYSTLIKATWVVLICCFIVKLFGGNFFEIACNNEKFIRFCAKYQETIVEYIIAIIMYSVSTSLYILAILKTKIFFQKQWILAVLVLLLAILKVVFYEQIVIITILEIIVVIITPMMFLKNRWYRSVIAYGLMTLFQIISLLIKNIGIKIIDTNFLLTMIFSIDYYIMILLYYFYAIKEEDDKNGKIWTFISRFRKRRNDNSNR